MPKPLSQFSLVLLRALNKQKRLAFDEIKQLYDKTEDPKRISATLYRLEKLELVVRSGSMVNITEEGERVIHTYFPLKDGIWKLIIFDIPESERYVRNVLRSKLQALGFKKWQNSIWASPYALDPELEKELKILAAKYFVRLIKTTDINETSDLEALFTDQIDSSGH